MKYDLDELLQEIHHLSALECVGHNFDVVSYTIDSRSEDMDEALVEVIEKISMECDGYTARIFVVRS